MDTNVEQFAYDVSFYRVVLWFSFNIVEVKLNISDDALLLCDTSLFLVAM